MAGDRREERWLLMGKMPVRKRVRKMKLRADVKVFLYIYII
jgi:hypothetical protein